MSIESFATVMGVTRDIGLDDLVLFTEGKEAKSPYDDPDLTRPSKISNLYERLGLDNFTEDQDAIKVAYRKQAKIWHPDRPQNQDHARKADEDYKAIKDSYDTLRDAGKKADYDSELRAELGASADFQENPGNAEKAAKVSRSFVDLEEIDAQLSSEQRRKVDYLDSLVDGGEIYLAGFGEVYMANMGNPCQHCDERIPSRGATIAYRDKKTSFADIEVHNLLAHGARAMVATAMNSYPDHWENRLEMAFTRVDLIYRDLNITLPPTHIEPSADSGQDVICLPEKL